MALAIISFLIGGALGVRFKVLVVIPAIGSAMLGAAGDGMVHGDPIGSGRNAVARPDRWKQSPH